MFAVRTISRICVLTATALLAASLAGQTRLGPRLTPKSAQPPASSAASPAARARTPAQMPPLPPQVAYSNGMLTIYAPNSTLADVLKAVAVDTGAQMDVPPQAAADRVAVQLGPVSPRQAMASLLDGSQFDYILVAPATDPNGIQRMILTVRSPASETAAAAPAQAAPPNFAQPPQVPVANTGDEDEGFAVAPQEVPQPPEQPQEGAQPAQQPQQPQIKTPQQLLQELQQMQQQQIQQMQQNNGVQRPQRPGRPPQ